MTVALRRALAAPGGARSETRGSRQPRVSDFLEGRLRLIGGVALVARSHPMLSTHTWPIPIPIGLSVGQLAFYFFMEGKGWGVCGLSVGLGSGMAAALAAFISAREIANLARGSSGS